MPADDITIELADLPELIARIPAEDFIAKKYDTAQQVALTDILFILSTPRSGSTLLSDLLHKNHICLPHEYFQPFEYLPILADRWGCINQSIVDKRAFVDRLIQYRTSPRGWLGINLHGHHLPVFRKFETLFPEVNQHFIHVQRQDIFAQAVSYDIAAQTGKWSSHYAVAGDAVYRFAGPRLKLDRLHKQNDMINAYVTSKGLSCDVIYYEDLLCDSRAVLERVLPKSLHTSLSADSNLKKQASDRNREWIQRFSVEYFATKGCGYHPQKNSRKRGLFARRKAR